MAESLVNMEDLPDDVLILIMQFLDVEGVLACRLMCRRLCGLALDQYVWRHRSLSDDHPRAGAVLLLAPCLETLVVTGLVPTLAVTTTGCAVASLELRRMAGEPVNPEEYALIVHKQEALGRLRRLKLSAGMDRGVSTGPDVLARTVASCSGLESLEVSGWLPELSRPIVRAPSTPSLRRFNCLANECASSFVYTILAAHAATLEEVATGTNFPFQETVTAKMLAGLPRLRRLQCENPIGGLEAVAACPNLNEVSFDLYQEDLDQLGILVMFFRRASQLRRIHLKNCTEVITGEHLALLVEALLASSGPYLDGLALEGFEDVRPLLVALPLLRALRHLDLHAEPDEEVLRAITPATAPALTLLELGRLPVGQCPHAWLHGPGVQAALRENPALHILLRLNTYSIMCDPQDCASCVLGCHKEVRWGWEEERKISIGIFSHAPEQCPSPDVHTLAVDWQRGDDGKAMVTWIRM